MKRISESQVFVDESDRHAAFANTACNSLDGTMTNVTRAEYARDAGFKREWLAIHRPSGDIAASADVPVGIALEGCGQPLSFGDGADHYEERLRVAGAGGFGPAGWASGGRDLLKMVVSMDSCDLRVGFDADVRLFVNLLD